MRDQIVAAAQGLNAQQVAFGLTAYPRYHNECPEIVKDTANTANPITPLQAAGLISATSARTQLGISMAAAHYIARAVATDQVINLPIPVLYATNELTGTPVVGKGKDATGGTVVPGYGGGAPISSVNDCNIQNGVALSQQPNLTSAAQALMKQMVIEGKSTDEQWGTTKDGDALTLTPSFYQLGTGNAIEIAMGHVFGDPTTPVTNAILGLKSGAMKQPNFANNINDPNDPNFATMDAIMTRVVTGGQSPGAFGKLNETPAVTENGVTWKGGCYPCEVDALKEATPIVSAMLGFKIIMPEAQAMLWGHEGDQTEGYVASGSAQGIASKSGQGGSHEVNPTITDVPLSDMSDLDITNVGTLYAPAPASVTPPPAPVDVTTLRAAVAIIQQGPAGSALGTITTAGLDRVNSPLVAGQYGAANETFKYSLDTEKACKADVTDRLSASMTASTKDIVALAGLAEHPGLATPFSMQPDSPAATLWSAGKEREAAVATLVSAWAGTSNDSNALSLAIQSAAEKEFGLQDSMRWGSVVSPDLNSALSSYLADKAGLLSQGNNQAVAQEFVRAQYTDTQQMLKDQGVATVLLYRAQGDDPADLGTTQNVPTGPNDKGITTQAHDIIQTAQMRPISSWSTSLDVAIGSFGSPYGSLLTAQIPASQIMSTARTGVGCLNEHEMTVIGNVSKVYREDAADYGA
jgi:hypothetical protein